MKAKLIFEVNGVKTEERLDTNIPEEQKKLIEVILEYDTGEEYFEQNALLRAIKATSAYLALFDTLQEIFRPARKHGYPDQEIENLITQCGTFKHPDYGECSVGTELVGKLESKFYDIMRDNGVDLDGELE